MRKKNEGTSKKLKRINIVINVTLLIILFIVIIRIRYAKYIDLIKGEADVHIAKMICEMEVTPNEESEPVINPYCTIKVKNYKPRENITVSEGDNTEPNEDIAQTAINYKIQVIKKDDLENIEYYWKNSEGEKVAENTELTGSFVNVGVKDEAEYTIVFLNSGDKDISRSVEFKLIAVQDTK